MGLIPNTYLDAYRNTLNNYVHFNKEEWEIFSKHLYLKKYKKKEAFIVQGSVCKEIGFVFSGSFRFYFVKEGIEISNYFCFPGDLISSY